MYNIFELITRRRQLFGEVIIRLTTLSLTVATQFASIYTHVRIHLVIRDNEYEFHRCHAANEVEPIGNVSRIGH